MKIRLLLFVLISACGVRAQHLPAQQQLDWQKLVKHAKFINPETKELPNELLAFPIYRLQNNWMISLYGKIQNNAPLSELQALNCIVGKPTGQVLTCKVPLDRLSEIAWNRYFSYLEIPSKVAPYLDRAIKDTRADSVQKGLGLPAAFTGKDVFIGITDWGFDYTHPMFYDTLLQTSRVHAAWDQYRTGNAPANFAYGTEFNTPTALINAGSDTANIYSYHTHGSHVAGIAGGGGAGIGLKGMSIESEFLFCTFLIDAASVIDGFNWMHEKAQAAGKRLVVNMSWGLTYMGTLDGNSLLSQAIAGLSAQGVVFVASAGNNGNVNYHIKKVFNNDSFQARFGFYAYASNPNMWGQSITMWGEAGKDFGIRLRIFNSTNTLLAESDTIHTATISSYIDSFLVVNNDTLWYNVGGEHAHPLNGRSNLRLRVYNPYGYWAVLESFAENGTVHYWNVTELTTGVGNWGMPFYSYGNNGLAGDANYSIGEPTCSPDVISVGAHSSEYYTTNGNLVGGQLASFSSIGPLITEEMKPDITAPGVSVTSSISSFTDAGYTAAESVNFNGTDYDFAKFSGTSMSSPAVAGIAALILDANPNLSPGQVKQIIKSTARLDNNTGVIAAPGHVRWGMGKIHAWRAVLAALNTADLDATEATLLVIYPNPARDKITLLAPDQFDVKSVELIGLDGVIHPLKVSQEIDLTGISAGSYFVRVSNGEKWIHSKLVLY